MYGLEKVNSDKLWKLLYFIQDDRNETNIFVAAYNLKHLE